MLAHLTTPALKRAGLLCGLLLGELLILSFWLDGGALTAQPGLVGQIGLLGAWVLRFLVGFAAAFAAFAGMEGTVSLSPLFNNSSPVRGSLLLLHAGSAAIFGVLSAALYGNWQLPAPDLVAVAWIGAGLLALASLGLAFYALPVWTGLLASSGTAALYAVGVAGLGVAAVALSQSMWQSAANLTFVMVQVLVRPMLPNLIVQPEKMRLQGHTFGVIISQECSGLEGVGLMLVFGVAWLWLSRKDLRFPRAYLLIPAGVVIIYLLNAVRIAALLLLGDAGAPSIAAGGFHSQAGWIAFNGLALAMTIVVPKLRWFSARPLEHSAPLESTSENPTAAYLIPFLAILAAGMLARAASADFEWLYGIRFLAAASALWSYRKQLRTVDWRFSWWGPGIGVAVLLVWIGFDRWQAIPAAAMPSALAAGAPFARLTWVVFRTLAAVATVPIAEELAFRGFLMRRLAAADFEAVPLRSSSWLGLTASSVLFGLLHGDRWIAGTLAGLAFGWVSRHTNRIGDAIVAHATTNALLAFIVLELDQWQYW